MASTAKLEVFAAGFSLVAPPWYFRLRDKNGRLLFASEGYPTKGRAMRAVKAVQTAMQSAVVVVL